MGYSICHLVDDLPAEGSRDNFQYPACVNEKLRQLEMSNGYVNSIIIIIKNIRLTPLPTVN